MDRIAYNQAYYAKNRARECARARTYYKRNRKRVLERERRRREENLGEYKESKWRRQGIHFSWNEYCKMLETQNNKCVICEIKLERGTAKNGAMLDHNHATGRVRSILCQRCNVGLGAFKDKPELMQRAISYIATHTEITGR